MIFQAQGTVQGANLVQDLLNGSTQPDLLLQNGTYVDTARLLHFVFTPGHHLLSRERFFSGLLNYVAA